MIVQTQLRLLVLTTLLLCTTLVLETERTPKPAEADTNWTVFNEPPAYLHPRAALAFDLSGLRMPATDTIEAALLEAARSANDDEARAYAHLQLAVYYKEKGNTALASDEKRKAEYWRRIVRNVPQE